MNEYYEKFKKVLPINKAAKVFNAEHEFKKYLMHHIRENKGINGQGKGKEKWKGGH